VMDVDELVASVFLSTPTQILLDRIRPVACGRRSVAAGRVEDVARCLFAVVCVLAACFYWLLPFHQQVILAANVMCGGYHNFTMMSDDKPGVPFMNNDKWYDSCSAEAEREANNALGLTNSTFLGNTEPSLGNAGNAIMMAVVNFAFRACDTGRFMDANRDCKPVPVKLLQVLHLAEGELPQWPTCVPGDLCGDPPEYGPCWYSWAALQCYHTGPTLARRFGCD